VDAVHAPSGFTPLLFAAAAGCPAELWGALLAAGADVNAEGAHGATPLSVACVRAAADVAAATAAAGCSAGRPQQPAATLRRQRW
jgi:ankyrin repeat protein